MPDGEPKPATLVCVTGMHRSGTSIVARVLELLGVDFGPSEGMLEAAEENPHGFWEQRVVSDLDDDILATLGGSWYEPPILRDGWASSPALDPARGRIADTLATIFGAGGTAGLKDPRLSLLLPLWRGQVPRTVSLLVVRDPREVARSLELRNGIHSERSAYLWLRYVVAAWRCDPQHLLVHANELFDDLPPTLDRIGAFLGLGRPSPDVHRAVATIVDRGAWRSTATSDRGAMMRRAVGLHERIRAGDAVGDELERLHRGWLRRAAVERWLASPRRKIAAAVPRPLRARLAVGDRIRYSAGTTGAMTRR